jgi:hypothetical protein
MMCENILKALRTLKWSLEALLTVFLNRKQMGGQPPGFKGIKGILEKLGGQSENESLRVGKQIAMLIDEAKHPKDHVRHHPGSCPFWTDDLMDSRKTHIGFLFHM